MLLIDTIISVRRREWFEERLTKILGLCLPGATGRPNRFWSLQGSSSRRNDRNFRRVFHMICNLSLCGTSSGRYAKLMHQVSVSFLRPRRPDKGFQVLHL